DADLDFVAFGEELLDLADLDLEISLVGARLHPDFFELDSLLMLARFVLALGLLVLIAAPIQQPADGGHGHGGDFDQIQATLASLGECLGGGHDADDLAIFVYYSNLAGADALVDAGFPRAIIPSIVSVDTWPSSG